MSRERRNYTEAEHDYILENWHKTTTQIGRVIDRPSGSIGTYKKRMIANDFKYKKPYCDRKVDHISWELYEKVVNLFLHSKENSVKNISNSVGLNLQKTTRMINEYLDKTWA